MKNHVYASLVFSICLSILTVIPEAAAQATPAEQSFLRQQVTVRGGATVTQKDTESGLTFGPTTAGEGSVGYRFNFTRWIGVEGDYDFSRNSQKYISSTSMIWMPTDVHMATGAFVVNIPNRFTKRFQSFFSAGATELFFQPRESGAFDTQLKTAIMIGGGVDFPVSRHLAIRVQNETLIYKAPDFKTDALHTDKYAQTLLPSAGIVFKF